MTNFLNSLAFVHVIRTALFHNWWCSVAVSARHVGQRDQDVTGSERRLRSGPDEDPVSGQLGCKSGLAVGFCSQGVVQNRQQRAAVSTVCCSSLLVRFIAVLLCNVKYHFTQYISSKYLMQCMRQHPEKRNFFTSRSKLLALCDGLCKCFGREFCVIGLVTMNA